MSFEEWDRFVKAMKSNCQDCQHSIKFRLRKVGPNIVKRGGIPSKDDRCQACYAAWSLLPDSYGRTK